MLSDALFISSIVCLNFLDDDVNPSCPVVLTNTALPVTVALRIPAITYVVCVPCIPILIALLTAALAPPMQILPVPVVIELPALTPIAIFPVPVVTPDNAPLPTAVLLIPVHTVNALNPTAVQSLPVEFALRA